MLSSASVATTISCRSLQLYTSSTAVAASATTTAIKLLYKRHSPSVSFLLSSSSVSLSTLIFQKKSHHKVKDSSIGTLDHHHHHHHRTDQVNQSSVLLSSKQCHRFLNSNSSSIGNPDNINNTNTNTNIQQEQQKQDQQQKKQQRLRRCLFSVPGHILKMIQKVSALNNIDSIVFDLEDGVPISQKDFARQLIKETLQNDDTINNSSSSTTITTTEKNNNKLSFGTSEICIRINDLSTQYALQDLLTIVPNCSQQLQTIVIPKVESEHDIYFVRRLIDSLVPNNTIQLIAAIESAHGLLNIHSIAQTSTVCNVTGLIFASEDYCADIEAIRTVHGTELLYARSQLVVTAKAYNIHAIDMVHINFRNISELITECQSGVELGFTGKQAIHPLQINPIQTIYTSLSNDKLQFAVQIIQQFTGTPIEINGIVIDTPMYMGTKISIKNNWWKQYKYK